MNYANHILRTDLQEWKNRLYRAPRSQFGNQMKYFFKNIDNNKQLHGLMVEVVNINKFNEEQLKECFNRRHSLYGLDFESEGHQAAFCYQFIKYVLNEIKGNEIYHYHTFMIGDVEQTITKLIEDFFAPIIYYLHDRLDKSNSVIYLLEKYKKRVEWFTQKELYRKYDSVQKNYEQVLEDDLRLFLFDQGIDYPFSTPSSASGRADLVGQIDTEDPLIAEIKIFDRNKGYGKNRIKGGFNQTVKYANDYNKDVGYFVIFNMDNVEINLNFSEKSNMFPAALKYNNKTFFFVIINCGFSQSASKAGTLEEVVVTEEELIKEVSTLV